MAKGDVKCLELAAQRCGVLSRHEALEHLTVTQVQTRLERGLWVRVFPAVYRVRGAPETCEQRRLAAQLWSGAALSHRAAAAVHGLAGFADSEEVEVTSRHRLVDQPGVITHRGSLWHTEVVTLGSFKVTSMNRTLVDLGSVASTSELRAAVQDALRKKATTLDALEVAARRRRPGSARLRGVLAELRGQGGPTDSELEEAALELIAMAELPKPRVQKPVKAGNRRARLDLIFEAQGVVVECDGYAVHSDVRSFEADRARNNRLTAQGYRVLHWTWAGIHDRPEELVLDLAHTLAR